VLRALVLPALAVASALAPAAAAAQDDWQSYRHSSGARLSHPPSWRIEEMPNGIALWPGDAQPAEMIVATGMPANGTTDPASSDVAAYLDMSLAQMLPGLARDDGPQEVDAANGAGALYRYTATLLDGSEVACDVYVTIENDVALSLSAIAAPAVLRERSATLSEIFGTFSIGGSNAPPTADAEAPASTPTGDDPRLVGMFAGEALAGGAGAGVYVNTQLVYVLNADGSLYYGAQSHFNASQRDVNGNTRWSATGTSDGSIDSGRWIAANGMLTIRWDSGQQSVFAYGFEPDGSLVLRHPTTRKLINFYRRVR